MASMSSPRWRCAAWPPRWWCRCWWRGQSACRLRTRRARGFMAWASLLVTVRGRLLYAAVARMPVGLALLVFDGYPIWATLAARVLYGRRPERAALIAMPVILLGLMLALDVVHVLGWWGCRRRRHRCRVWCSRSGAAAASASCSRSRGVGVADLDGRLRSAFTMAVVGVLALVAGLSTQGGLHWPNAPAGWWGLARASACCTSTAFTAVVHVAAQVGRGGATRRS